jgi:hypothetical protein
MRVIGLASARIILVDPKSKGPEKPTVEERAKRAEEAFIRGLIECGEAAKADEKGDACNRRTTWSRCCEPADGGGRVEMLDLPTGEKRNVPLGSYRRLQTI